MRIAQIAPIVERIPPEKYGGTERVVATLTEELVKRGHEVTLFASGDSLTSAALSSTSPISLRKKQFEDLYGANMETLAHVGAAYALHSEFDIMHDHTGTFGLPTGHVIRTPVITTYHGPLTPEIRHAFTVLNRPHLVTISDAQIKGKEEGINHLGTVYNGLSMESYPFSNSHDGYLLCVGRLSKEKGFHHAMNAAKAVGMPLIIAAKLDPLDQHYFETMIEPHLTDSIRWVGEVDERKRNTLYSRAAALLHPVDWPEPFGLVLIEAMACGTPVIAFSCGAIPEVVKDGVSGFVVASEEEMAEKIKKIDIIDRMGCRTYALQKFSAQAMADGYEALYQKIAVR